MSRRSILIILSIALLGLNIFLFFRLDDKSRNLGVAKKLLNDEDFVDITRSSRALPQLVGDTSLALAADRLSDTIDSLRFQISASDTEKPKDHFTKAISVDKKIQAGLWDVYQKFNAVATVFLETDLPASRARLAEVHERALGQFQDIEAKAKSSTPGKHKLLFHYFIGMSNEYQVYIEWTKQDDSVSWGEGHPRYIEYITWLESKINSTHAQQSKQYLDNFHEIFVAPGKVAMDGETYDLSKITSAELLTLCEYLSMVQNEMVKSISSTSRDLTVWL